MASATRSKRQIWREENKDDIVHILEEMWCAGPYEVFYIIFNKYEIRGIDTVIELSKLDLESLKLKEYHGDLSSLMKNEIGCIRASNNRLACSLIVFGNKVPYFPKKIIFWGTLFLFLFPKILLRKHVPVPVPVPQNTFEEYFSCSCSPKLPGFNLSVIEN